MVSDIITYKAEVFAQVSKLFGHAPDLISEFKQFLPEINGGPLNNADNFGSVVQAAANEPSAALGQKRAPAKDAAQPPAGKKRRAPEPKGGASKVSHSPIYMEGLD